jgi:phosphatidate cytidylyltransferase
MIGVLDTAPYVAGALGAGGVGVLASRQRELIRRWTTWALTAPIVGGALLLGVPGAAVLAGVLAIVATAEYGRLTRLPIADRYLIGTALVGTIVTSAIAPSRTITAILVGVAAIVALPMISGDTDDGAGRAAYGVLGFGWLSALAGLVLLHSTVMALIIAVSGADIAAWGAGRAVPSPRLSPLSPAKGWSGLVGGAVTGIGVLALFGALTPATALAVAVGGPVGDLFESMLKRGAGVKDTGTWLPGFGGLLDRIDSLLIALAIAALLSGTALS